MTDSIGKNSEKMSFDDIKKISEGIMGTMGSNLIVKII